MKNDIQKLLQKLKIYLGYVRHYGALIFIVTFLSLYAYLSINVNRLVQTEPSQLQIDEKLKTIPRTKIDQSVLDSILELQNQNIEVKSLFDHARDNPFNE